METTEILRTLHKELQSIISSIEQISESVDRITAEMETLSPGVPFKGIAAKRSPARKKVLFKDGVVQQVKRIPSTKIVYDILLKSATGMDTTALMKATGFNQRKIHNITFRLKNQGKIKTMGRGIYKTA